ncbi:MAG: transcriptional/translational regulatory protein YebC/TACO1 [Spirosomataceae bacterium]
MQVKRKKKKVRSAEDQRILDAISQGVKELNQYKRGEIELQNAFEMLNEVCDELEVEAL